MGPCSFKENKNDRESNCKIQLSFKIYDYSLSINSTIVFK